MAQDEKYPLALPQGTILAGQYVIEKALGQGGFGITYKATDHKTGESVAVKEFFPDSLASRTTQTTVTAFPGERGDSFVYGKVCFLQEAETLAEFIGNEHIVRVFSYFEENGTAYFVMEFIEGTSFDRYIKEQGGKVSYEEAEKILLPVIDALAVVHAKGIVHRDVTPDNIYITKDGNVKLLDFGAARYSLGDKSRSLDVVLKHGFAPKEQYTRHGRQGAFTDVYTVGASFYFAVTGRRPPDSIDRMDEDELIPPSRLGVKIAPEKEDAILKAMSVQPANRYQTMVDFREALVRAPEEEMQNVEAQAAAAVPLQGAAAAQEVPLQPVQQRVFTAAQQSAQPEAEAKPVQQISQSVPEPVYIQQQPNVQAQPAPIPQNVGVQPIQQPEPVQEAKNKEQQPTPVQQTAQQRSGKGTKIIAVLGILGSIVFEAMPNDFIFFRNCSRELYHLLHFLIGIALMLAGIYAVFRLVEKQNVVSKKDRNVRIALCETWVVAIRGYRGFTFLRWRAYEWMGKAMATVAVLALIVAVCSFVIIMADKKKNGKMPQGDKDRTIAQINEVTAMLVALEGLYQIYLLRCDCSVYDFVPFLILSVLLPVLILASIYIAFVSMEKQIGMRNNEKRKYRIARIVLCELVVVSLGRWMYQLETGKVVAWIFIRRVYEWGNLFNWHFWYDWYWNRYLEYYDNYYRYIGWFYAVLCFLVIAFIAAVSLCILKNGRKKDGEIPQESERETALIRRTAIFVTEEGMLMLVVVFLLGRGVRCLSGWELHLNSAYLLYGIFLMLVGISVAHGCSQKCDDRYKKESKRYRSARLVLCESVPFAVVFATMRDGYSTYSPGVLMKLTVISPIVMIAMISLIVMITNRNKSTT